MPRTTRKILKSKWMTTWIRSREEGQGTQPVAPKLGPAPEVPEAEKIPSNLSNYVDFLHPWGNVILNPIVLLLMFFGLVLAAILALRAQDIG